MKRLLSLSVIVLLPAVASADVITLRGGGELRGLVVERRADAVVLEVGPGRVTLPMSRVLRISSGGNELSEYRARAAAVPAGDADAWAALGEWARERGLYTPAGEAFARALAIDPRHERANLALGHVRLAGRWVTSDQWYREQGYQRFDGRWVSADEHRALLAERGAEATRRAELLEAEARVREAEARARAAEAEARRAEADLHASPGDVPYYPVGGGVVYGSGGVPVYGYDPQPPSPPVVVVVKPRPSPPLRDRGADRHGDRGRHSHRPGRDKQ
jgi:hypothetical protein